MRFFIFLVPGKVPVCRLLGSTRNFRPEVPGSTRKFLDQPRSSWFNQEDHAFSKTVFVFYRKFFLVMGPFSTTRNEPWSKNAESCLKITNNNSFFYRIMFLTCRSYPPHHPQPISGEQLYCQGVTKGF